MSRRAWFAFAALSVIWGVPYLFIKVAVDDGVSPFFLSWARLVLGAGVLTAIAPRQTIEMARTGPWRWLVAYAVAEMALPFPLIAAGEQHVDSSIAAIVIATVPLIIALLALRFDHTERPTRTRMTGMLIGLTGVIALVGIDLSGRSGEVLGAGAVLLAAFGYAVGPMIIKRQLVTFDPFATMAASLWVAAALLTPAGLLTVPGSVPPTDAVISLIVLGLVCTAAAFVILMVLVSEVGAGRASIITYINPVIAVGLGVVVLGESPGAGAIGGLLLILAGSWLATDDRLPPNPTAIVTRRRRGREPAVAEPSVPVRAVRRSSGFDRGRPLDAQAARASAGAGTEGVAASVAPSSSGASSMRRCVEGVAKSSALISPAYFAWKSIRLAIVRQISACGESSSTLQESRPSPITSSAAAPTIRRASPAIR
jgi:drug/metabolite transporter (DMT)-like permease